MRIGRPTNKIIGVILTFITLGLSLLLPAQIVGAASTPDLTVTSVSYYPSSAQVGQSISVTFTVRNQGTTASGSFSNRISLSPPQYQWGTAYSLGYFPMDSLAAGDSRSLTVTTNPISTSVPCPGSYYVTVYTDGLTQISESNENNNIGSSTPSMISVSCIPQQVQYTLSVNINGQGATNPGLGSHPYDAGIPVTIVAIPSDGWTFSSWGGDASGTSTSTTVVMNSNKNVIAYFSQSVPTQVSLTLYVHEDNASGPVISGAQVSGWDGAGASFNQTTNSSGYVVINGIPGTWQFNASSAGYQANSWQQSITVTQTRHAFLYKEATTQYTLNISINGQGATNPGLGSHPYDASIPVTIVAAPSDGWTFNSWGGDASGTSTSTTVVMNSNKNVIANFSQSVPTQVSLTLYVHEDNASGPVISGAQVSGWDGAGASFNQTTNSSGYVVINCIPGTWQFNASRAGYQTNSWQQSITVTQTRHAFLYKEATTQYTLNINVNGQGATNPGMGSHLYEAGTQVTIIAVPSDDWTFSSWGGDASGTSTSTTITMNSSKNVIAYFSQAAPTQYFLTINTNGLGTTSPAWGTYYYDQGTQVTVMASPASGWNFSYWGGDASGTSTSTTITMNSNKNITAYFSRAAATQYTVNIIINGQGATNPGLGSHNYDAGTRVTITAVPSSGWRFSSWGGDASGTSTSTTITIDSNKSVIANFTGTITTETTDQQKQREILNMVQNHRGQLPTECILAIVSQEGGNGAFYVNGWKYNSFYREADGTWAQPTNGDGIMQVTSASGYHENSGAYTNDHGGYNNAIEDGCDYLLNLYKNSVYGGTYVQTVLHYNTGPNSLYIYLGRNWGDRNYLANVAGNLNNFVPNLYDLQNQGLVDLLNQGQAIVNQYLYDKGIATGQAVDYYKAYQTQLDNALRNIGQISDRDIISPTISISSPTNGQNLTDPVIYVTGMASDDAAVNKVEVRVGTGSWQTASGTTSWSIQVTLNSGSNIISARATDTAGNTRETSVTQINWQPSNAPTPMPTPTPTPTPAPTPVDSCSVGQFRAEYFDNSFLRGSPVSTGCESGTGGISYNWQLGGPPYRGVGNDNFSVRWEGNFDFSSSGYYTFYAKADDGIKVSVDDKEIINDWMDHPAREQTGGDYISAGQHKVTVEYYENGGLAEVQVNWRPSTAPSPSPTPSPEPTPVSPSVDSCALGQFRAEYFDNRFLAGSPVSTGCESGTGGILYNWQLGGPPYRGVGNDNFSVRWEGNFNFSSSGDYTFYAKADDGIKVSVDDKEIINDWIDHAAREQTGGDYISAGQHKVTVEYYENGGLAEVQVNWRHSAAMTPTLKWPLSGKSNEREILLSFGKNWTWGYCGGLPKKHLGVDLNAVVGEIVYASESGTVRAVYDASSEHNWGKCITIEHDGFTTTYQHIVPLVSIGQSVLKGQKIATIANIDVPHLHYGVRIGTYSNISNRGALPQKNSAEDSHCQNDPIFPEKFIDPMNLNYE